LTIKIKNKTAPIFQSRPVFSLSETISLFVIPNFIYDPEILDLEKRGGGASKYVRYPLFKK